MPGLSFYTVPGFIAANATSIDLTDNVAVDVVLRPTAPLFADAGEVTFSVTLDEGSRTVTLRQKQPVVVQHGLLEVQSLEIELKFQGGAGSNLATLVSGGVRVTGVVAWIGTVPDWMPGVAGQPDLQLEVSFAHGTFQLGTPSAVDLRWPRQTWNGIPPIVTLAGGARIGMKPQLTAEGDPGVLVTVHASGSFADGSPIDQVTSVIEGLGVQDPAILDPIDALIDGSARLSTSFLLSAGDLLAWSAKILPTGFNGDPLSDAITEVLRGSGGPSKPLFKYGLGRPAFEAGADEGSGGAPSGWRLWFDECSLGFPEVLSVGPTSIAGRLRLDATTRIEFLPSSIQTLDLPDLLKFILGRIELLGSWISSSDLAVLVESVLPLDEWIPWIRTQLEAAVPVAQIIESVRGAVDLAGDQLHLLYELIFRAILGFEPARAISAAMEAWMACFGTAGTIDVAGALDFLGGVASIGHDATRLLSEALVRAMLETGQWSDAVGALAQHLMEMVVSSSAPTPMLRFATDMMTGVVQGIEQLNPSWKIGEASPEAFRDLAVVVLDLLSWESGAGRPIIGMSAPEGGTVDVAPGTWFVGHVMSGMALQVPAFRDHAGWRFVPDGGAAFLDQLTALGASLEAGASSIVRWLAAILEVCHTDLTDLRIHVEAEPPLSTEEQQRVTEARAAVRRERGLLKLVRLFPPLALPFVITEAVAARFRPDPALRFTGRDLESDPRTKALRLPPPGSPMPSGVGARSYLILSDVHRDCDADSQGMMRFGSIDHFRDNKAMYIGLLQEALESGKTVIEDGDCEELWFIRDPLAPEEQYEHSKLRRILQDNADVYALLWELARQGRYFRVFGNHDSYLRLLWHTATAGADPEASWDGFLDEWLHAVRSVRPGASRSELESVPMTVTYLPGGGTQVTSIAWKPYDAFIIDGVKTMQDHNVLNLLGELSAVAAPGDGGEAALKLLQRGRLGMNADEYDEVKPLVVMHGHQFDYWNCDQNALLGKLIANTAGVIVDGLMDPFLDIRGIALGGRALLDFRSIFGGLPIADGFLDRHQSIQMAHAIQHRPDRERVTVDDVLYLETLVAVITAFTMPLRQPRVNNDYKAGTALDDPQKNWSRFQLDQRGMPVLDPVSASGPDSIASAAQALVSLDFQGSFKKSMAAIDWFVRPYMNAFCIGHTHLPQSQPYLPIPAIASPLVSIVGEAVNTVLPGAGSLFDDTSIPLRTRYYNTGTCAWYRGVGWGLEISKGGTPNLFYVSSRHSGFGFNGPFFMDWELEPLDTDVVTWRDNRLNEGKLVSDMNGLWDGFSRWWSTGLERTLQTAPSAFITAPASFALFQASGVASSATIQLPSAGASPAEFQQAMQDLGRALCTLFVALGQRLLGATFPAPTVVTVRVPLPPGGAAAAQSLESLLADVTSDQARSQAVVGALAAIERLPYRFRPANAAMGAAAIGADVLFGVVTTFVNGIGDGLHVHGHHLKASVERSGGTLEVALTVSTSGGAS